MGNFHNYQNRDVIPEEAPGDEEQKTPNKVKVNKDFSLYQDLQKVNGKQPEDIFYTFLNKVYDSHENELEDFLPLYLYDWMSSGTISPQAVAKGVNRYIKVVPD